MHSAAADSYFHQIERRIESVVRQHGLDGEKVVWMPRDIQFGGFEFPDSNINAGVLLFARKPETQVCWSPHACSRCMHKSPVPA